MHRRGFLVAGAAVIVVPVFYVASRPAAAETEMTPAEVSVALKAGDIHLIDVRRPDEWATTGIAEGAVPIDMRREDFVAQAKKLAASGKPIAVICARGVRSRRVSGWLEDAGVEHIIDVPEGMLGSAAGPGWLARDLPILGVNEGS